MHMNFYTRAVYLSTVAYLAVVAAGASAQTFVLAPGAVRSEPISVLRDTEIEVAQGAALSVDGTAVKWNANSTTLDVTNAGIIESIEAGGRALDAKGDAGPRSLRIINESTGIIRADNDAIRINSDVTTGPFIIENAGTIISTGSGQAIDFDAISSSSTGQIEIKNEATGIIRAEGADAIRPGQNAHVSNKGLIYAGGVLGDKNDAVDFQSHSGEVVNLPGGIISGQRHGITASLNTELSVFNGADALIIGRNGSGVGSDGTGSVTNYGRITGDSFGNGPGDGDGIDIDFYGFVDNYGIIEGVAAIGNDAGGNLNNSEGVAITGGGVVRNHAGASISGAQIGVTLFYGADIINDGTISGGEAGLVIAYNQSRVVNSGTISGGLWSILMYEEDDILELNRGSILNGTVEGGGGVNTLILNDGVVFDKANNFTSVAVRGAASIIGDSFIDETIIENGSVLTLGNGGDAGSTSGEIKNDGELIVDHNADISFNRAIAGAGSVSLVGNGIVSFNAANTYTGDTRIQAGTLKLGTANAIADASSVSVGAAATFDLAGFDETIGTLSGTGTIALGAGSLSVGSTNADFGFHGTVSGSGDLTKTGTGIFALAGTEPMTGHLNANAGTLSFTGASDGGARVQGGTLTGAGSFAGNLALSSGTLAPGTSTQPVGAFQIGSMTATGGTYVVSIAGSGGNFASDVVRVTGAATLGGTMIAPIALEASGNYLLRQTYTVLQAGTLTGTFANATAFTKAADNGDLYYRLRYDLMPNTVLLEVRKQVDFTAGLTTAASGNQRAVASAISGDALAASDSWAESLSAISALSIGQRQTTYDSIGGESLASVTTQVAFAGNRFTDLLRGRLGTGTAAISDPTALAQLSGTAAQTGALRAGTSLAANASAMTDGTGEQNGAWLQGFGADGTLKGGSGQARVANHAAGIAGGFDAKFGLVTAGIAGTITDMDSSVQARGGRNSGTLYQGGGYVAFDDGVTYANVIGSYFAGTVDTVRTVSIGANLAGIARGNANTDGYAGGGTLGRRIDLSDGMLLTPQVGGQVVHVTRDAFTETGVGGLSLAAGRETRDLYSATGQLRLSHRTVTSSGVVEPYVTGGVQVNFGDRDTLSALRFTGAPAAAGAFTIAGARVARTAALLGGGLDARPNDTVTIGASFDSTVAKIQNEARVSMHIRVGL